MFFLVLPAGSLMGYFFSRDHPSYMNYGSLGSIIGHEINHGFDSIVSINLIEENYIFHSNITLGKIYQFQS